MNPKVSAEALLPYADIFKVDRAAMGFPPLPTNGTVRILIVDREHWNLAYPPPNHDVTLQFYTYGSSSGFPYTSRYIALTKRNGQYKWVQEQMRFQGTKTYNPDPDAGAQNEWISIERSNGMPTVIGYGGPDNRLTRSSAGWRDFGNDLTISQIGPILREWGYAYDLDRIQKTNAIGGNTPSQH